jgi:hypothetical protein
MVRLPSMKMLPLTLRVFAATPPTVLLELFQVSSPVPVFERHD